MGFVLSKQILSYAFPGLLCIWAVTIIVLVIYERKRTALGFLIGSFSLFWLLATPAFSDFMLGSLERRYAPVSVGESPCASAIVVLGGCLVPGGQSGFEVELTDASDRILHTARLYRENKASIVIATGGAAESVPEAYAMGALLREWGVPASAIVLETQSLNTHQNALNTKAVLEKRGLKSVLLVTSALHMPRALATFRTAGIEAIPSPTDYGVVNKDDFSLLDFLPEVEAFRGTLRAVNEYLGLLAYRLRGWTE